MTTKNALEPYRKKRDFSLTAEPEGQKPGPRARARTARSVNDLTFVIQRHQARRLHYDFRLELEGVLKSWAVPKGPSRDPSIKRLAVAVEDHPLEYGSFEGEIPAGQYGAGTVQIWDSGTWQPKGNPLDGMQKGRLHFTLYGNHLQGEWILIRTGKDNQWLLRKLDDAYVVPDDDAEAATNLAVNESSANESSADKRAANKRATVLDNVGPSADPDRDADADASKSKANTRKTSGKKTTTVKNTAAPSTNARAQTTKVPHQSRQNVPIPEVLEPQLATLAATPPSGSDWVYEIKYDGYRMLCRVEPGKKPRFVSRTGKDWTPRMRALSTALKPLLNGTGWIDGEVVVFDDHGHSNFQMLQNALDSASNHLHFVAFDLPWWAGVDLRHSPLHERYAQLEALLTKTPADAPLSLADRLPVDDAATGQLVLDEACRLGLEGLIAKSLDAPYRANRTTTWLKLKCRPRQEFIVGGYTSPSGARSGFGSLLLGINDGAELRYVGRVGSGFDAHTLSALHTRLRHLKMDASPFTNELPPEHRFANGIRRTLHWVRPELVVEVGYSGWTSDGVLRQASFLGLREDKPATDVTMEHDTASTAATQSNAKRVTTPTSKRSSGKDTKSAQTSQATVHGIRISNPQRLVYKTPNITKREVAEYYEAVADHLLPHVKKRRLAFLRCPEGTTQECFFQKHIHEDLPQGLERDGEHILVRNTRGLIELAQRGVIELHTWGSTLPRADRADRITLDLDPGPNINWPTLVEAALLTATLVQELGLTPFVKTTGGKGLHLVMPIRRTLDWPSAKQFARGMAQHMATHMPDRFTANMSKKRRVGRIFIDYLRNGENATAIAAYSLRARTGAPVSVPLSWDELNMQDDLRETAFTIKNVQARLNTLPDPWADYEKSVATVSKNALNQMRGD